MIVLAALTRTRSRQPETLRSWVALLCPAVLALLSGGAGGAGAARAQEPDLNDLALDWARGQYVSPLVCEFDGAPIRGLRRIQITPGPRHTRPPVDRIIFVELEAEQATRCVGDLGAAEPNVRGSIQIRLRQVSRPDLARRDFTRTLERKGGFEFDVPAGGLRIQEIGPDGASRDVAFRGGKVRIHELSPGSDEARVLKDLQSSRKLLLELEAPDGSELRFPLALSDVR